MADKIFNNFTDWVNTTDMPNGKRKVLQAAVELFSEKGYAGTSTSEIAKLSGMSEATVFKYFKTKHELLESILEPMVEHLVPSIAQDFVSSVQAHQMSLDDFINFIVHDRYAFFAENQHVIMILLTEFLTNKDFVEKAKTKISPYFENLLAQVEKIGGDELAVTPVEVIRIVGGQLVMYLMQQFKLMPEAKFDVEHDLDEIVQSSLRAIKKV
ncbi:AcrR family transcriptional regulator [Weissella uvarum]|uniref:TetR/AcrR family transcriptional regulator n=1 Tax=Weissella uvarum TaxID=1479233 RepID=UPI0019600606|nr:TetR/AcrR family transcriptional regulator [Weissella uvarum]MBM7617536.1 AcrR family transcriptional regulator [Weissella uvarum]MCM0595580.1 TetR/AcrR family transcriptional regulator [Weissella uvarum]